MSIEEKLIEITNNVPLVYNAGYEKGKAEGGGGSGDDTFWDIYQNNGNRTSYAYAFAGEGWNNITFKPKYNIIPSGTSTNMFYGCGFSGNLASYLKSNNITLDLKNSTNCSNIFATANKITHLPSIDLSKATNTSGVFSNCANLTSIEALKITDKQTTASNWFYNCGALTNLIITKDSTIFANLDLRQSTKLSRVSIESIVNALSNLKSGGTLTLSKTAKEKAFPNAADWDTLIAPKKNNWTITLV